MSGAMVVVVADAGLGDRPIAGSVHVVVPGKKESRRESDAYESAPRSRAMGSAKADVVGERERGPERHGVPIGIAEPIRVA